MGPNSKKEYLEVMRERYAQASGFEKGWLLDEFVSVYGCHRKHAIRLLGRAEPACPRSLAWRMMSVGKFVGRFAGWFTRGDAGWFAGRGRPPQAEAQNNQGAGAERAARFEIALPEMASPEIASPDFAKGGCADGCCTATGKDDCFR